MKELTKFFATTLHRLGSGNKPEEAEHRDQHVYISKDVEPYVSGLENQLTNLQMQVEGLRNVNAEQADEIDELRGATDADDLDSDEFAFHPLDCAICAFDDVDASGRAAAAREALISVARPDSDKNEVDVVNAIDALITARIAELA